MLKSTQVYDLAILEVSVLIQVWMGSNQGVGGLPPFGSSSESPFPHLGNFSRSPTLLTHSSCVLPVASSSSSGSSPPHDTISLVFSPQPPSSTYKDPCDDIGLIPNTRSSPHVKVRWFTDWMPFATLIPLCQVTYCIHFVLTSVLLWGADMDVFVGSLFCLCQPVMHFQIPKRQSFGYLSVLVHLDCCNKTPLAGWLINNRHSFFTVQ